jgi:uncharacterized membrane protein YhiD involved in acid resistance
MWTYFTELNLISVLFRLFLSMMLAGLLGMERSSREKPAGFRTYMMMRVTKVGFEKNDSRRNGQIFRFEQVF